jgi:hypothetical protein
MSSEKTTEKIEAFWVNATADDVAETMKTGKPIPARVRNDDVDLWLDDAVLQGWINGNWAARGAYWAFCQVYREPSWWTKRPDPGPGFRLLEKFPDEELKPGDEGWDVWNDGEWAESDNANGGKPQSKRIWYRRRIEPVEPKFAVGQTVRVVGPKGSDAKHWDSEMARHAGTLQTVKYIEEFANPTEIFYGVYGIDSRKFREDYLEAVEPVESKPLLIRRRVIEIGDEIKLPNGRVLVFNGEGFEVTQ